MIKNEIAKVVRILTQYDGECHTLMHKDEMGIDSELVKIPVDEDDFKIEVGNVFQCTQVNPLLLERIDDENILSSEQFIEMTQNFDSIPYNQLIEMFEWLKGKVGLFCKDYPDCSMKFLILILAHYDNVDNPHDLSPAILEFLNSETVSNCLKEEAQCALEELYTSEKIEKLLHQNKVLRDFTKDEFYQLNFHLCKLESGQKILELLLGLEKYFDFSWNKEEENQKGHEKKIGEMEQS